MTEAQRIAAKLNDDGTCWVADNGRSFSELVAYAAERQRQPNGNFLHIFNDGSAIIETSDWWDITGFHVVRLDYSIVDEWGHPHQTHYFSDHRTLGPAVQSFRRYQKEYNSVDIIDDLGCPVEFIY